MAHLYLIPKWFFGFDIGMQILFAVFTALVAYHAFKIYKLSCQKESRLLGTGFILIAFSYLVKAGTIFYLLRESTSEVYILDITKLNTIGLIGTYTHVMLYTIGLVTLAYLTFKIDSRRVYSLLLATNILVLAVSQDKAQAFNLFSSLIILYICAHYAWDYYQKRNPKILLLLMAFAFLLASNIQFVFAVDYYGDQIIRHFLELASYLLILISLLLTTRKNEQKKNKT